MTGIDCTVSMFPLFAHIQSLFIITYTQLFTGTDCTVSMFPLFAHIQSLFIITYTQLPTAPMYHCFKVIPNTLCSASDAFYCLYHHSSILMPFIVGFPLHLFPWYTSTQSLFICIVMHIVVNCNNVSQEYICLYSGAILNFSTLTLEVLVTTIDALGHF